MNRGMVVFIIFSFKSNGKVLGIKNEKKPVKDFPLRDMTDVKIVVDRIDHHLDQHVHWEEVHFFLQLSGDQKINLR